ncbi:hypothetical protein AYK20_03630 [Thermoplasmatales archaeon SG8-52-1]|nr:MAG: hypothetical protein AYK20_03630 [Thermoplasmatales archaeon SG8-52-1]
MVFKGGSRDNKIYTIIAIFVIIIIVFAVFFSSNDLNEAIIDEFVLNDAWIEDISERDSGSQLFGLEKWISYKYVNKDDIFPAYITVTSIKTIFMKNEEDLISQTLETIKTASKHGIVVDDETKITGERSLSNGHKTMYVIFNGSDTSKEPDEQIKIIGETWNCGPSGTSIICIGLAQVTNHLIINTSYWEKIIRDKKGTFGQGSLQGTDGLLFNVKCH